MGKIPAFDEVIARLLEGKKVMEGNEDVIAIVYKLPPIVELGRIVTMVTGSEVESGSAAETERKYVERILVK